MAFFRALNASCLVEPQPPLGLASECVEGAGNIGEVVDKLLIEVHKAKEGLDLLDLCWGWPFCNSVDLHWIHSNMSFKMTNLRYSTSFCSNLHFSGLRNSLCSWRVDRT